MKKSSAVLRDRAILAGWIAALALIAALVWSLSFSFRSACLMRAANKTLTAMDDPRRIEAPLLRPAAGNTLLGCWYTLADSDSLFLVFTMMREGILVPCGAEVAADGYVREIIPLGSHAQQVMRRIPPGQIQVYVRRIEAAALRGEG